MIYIGLPLKKGWCSSSLRQTVTRVQRVTIPIYRSSSCLGPSVSSPPPLSGKRWRMFPAETADWLHCVHLNLCHLCHSPHKLWPYMAVKWGREGESRPVHWGTTTASHFLELETPTRHFVSLYGHNWPSRRHFLSTQSFSNNGRQQAMKEP